MNKVVIRENEYKIEKIFGFNNMDDFIEALSGDNEVSSRLKFLVFIFMELLNKDPRNMFMGFMLSKILSAVTKEKLDTPPKIIKMLNDELTQEQLEDIFIHCGSAAYSLLGRDSNMTVKDLMKRFEDGEESK